MRSRHGFVLCALAAFALSLLPAAAGPVTDRQKHACRGDYQRFCGEYAVGSESLRACMSRSFKRLSNMCVSALVADGEVSRKQAESLRKGKKTTTTKHATRKRTYYHHHH